MLHTRYAPAYSRQWGWGKIAASLTLLCAAVFGVCSRTGQSSVLLNPGAARLSTDKASLRAAEFCAALGEPVTVTETPTFFARYYYTPKGAEMHRMWSVNCKGEERAFVLMMDDATGELRQLISGLRSADAVPSGLHFAPLDTPAEAASAAANVLRMLSVVPKGAHVALSQPPFKVHHGNAWQIEWKQTQPEQTRPRTIMVQVDRDGGTPLRVSCSN